MLKKDKGLADAQEGEFILNESGTAVSTDPVEGIDAPETNEPAESDKKNEQSETETEP